MGFSVDSGYFVRLAGATKGDLKVLKSPVVGYR